MYTAKIARTFIIVTPGIIPNSFIATLINGLPSTSVPMLDDKAPAQVKMPSNT